MTVFTRRIRSSAFVIRLLRGPPGWFSTCNPNGMDRLRTRKRCSTRRTRAAVGTAAHHLAEQEQIQSRKRRSWAGCSFSTSAVLRRHPLSVCQAATSLRMALPMAKRFLQASEAKKVHAVPTLFNCAWIGDLFWDGRSSRLEKQMIEPHKSHRDGHDGQADPCYIVRHSRLRCAVQESVWRRQDYDRPSIEGDGHLRTHDRFRLNSPYDRFKAGDKTALTELQQEGMETFFSSKARCDSCHEGLNFTNGKYANIGFGMDRPKPDLGLFNVTKAKDPIPAPSKLQRCARLHTPLRKCTTAVLLHEEVVEHYDKGGSEPFEFRLPSPCQPECERRAQNAVVRVAPIGPALPSLFAISFGLPVAARSTSAFAGRSFCYSAGYVSPETLALSLPACNTDRVRCVGSSVRFGEKFRRARSGLRCVDRFGPKSR